MNMGGRYLIVCSGPPGSRREEISSLLAGGAAYLSTVTEFTEGQTAVPSYHTQIVVLSTTDCFKGTRKDFEYNHELIPGARADVERRCDLGMRRGVAIIILDDPYMEKWEVKPFLELAEQHSYEVIAMGMLEQRDIVMATRRADSIKPVPDPVFERQRSMVDNRRWYLKDQDGGIFVNREDHRGHLIKPETGDPSTLETVEPDASQPGTTFSIIDIPVRGQGSLVNIWKFVMWATGDKMMAARGIVEQAMLAQDNSGAHNPVLRSPHTPVQLLRKATGAGITIVVR